MIRTRIYDEFLAKMGDDGSANEAIMKNQYAGIGETVDVANAVAFLLSQDSRFIVGSSLPIDGGTSSSSAS